MEREQAQAVCGKNDETNSKYPRWIPNQEQCQWCRGYTLEVESITEEEVGLLVKYLCSNEDCDRLHRFGVVSDFSVIHGGNSKENYRKFLEAKEI